MVQERSAGAAYTEFVDIDPFWLIVVVGILISMGVSGYQKMQHRTAKEDWARAAKELSLTLGSGGKRRLSMTGSEGKLDLLVEVRKGNDSTVTHYEVTLPPSKTGLKLAREGSWHSFMKVLGGQDIEVGDTTFDERFVIKANSAEAARRYLTPHRIGALNKLYDQHSGFGLSNDVLGLDVNGVTTDGDEIVTTLKNLLAAARLLQPDDEGDAATAASMVPETIIDPDSTRDQALQKVYETLDSHAADEAIDDVVAEPAVEELVVPAAPLVTAGDALRVAEALFGDNQLSFEVDRLFAAEYVGRTVDWSGTSKGAAGVRASSVLDDESDAILQVVIGAIEDELVGSSTVEAAVALADGTTLPDRGTPVHFTGRLHAVDGLTKTLFVADGQLG